MMRAPLRVLVELYIVSSLAIIILPVPSCTAHRLEHPFFPNPQLDYFRCGRRGQKSFVCDPERVLSFKDANKLDEILFSIRNDTGCSQCTVCKADQHGYTVSVAIVKDAMDGLSVNGFAEYLLHEWNYGSCKDDVVIVLAAKTKQVYSAVGRTADIALEYGVYVENIHDKVNRFIMSGNFTYGLCRMVMEYRSAFLGNYEYSTSFPTWPVVQICSVAFMVCLCLFVVCWCKRGAL
ncbi:uncharacterized protein [Ptychodera flava]|uniref:uncharacterized protein isoform X1 n=1 Tax=Ptychodera flava TaxID=63121 RepID=UPI00396A9A90